MSQLEVEVRDLRLRDPLTGVRRHVRFTAHNTRALDGSGLFRRLTEKRESGQLQSPFTAESCVPLVGPELHNRFGVDKASEEKTNVPIE
jgi:hypothetical protein